VHSQRLCGISARHRHDATRHAALLSRNWRLFWRSSPAWRGAARRRRPAAYPPGWRLGTGRPHYSENGRRCLHLRSINVRSTFDMSEYGTAHRREAPAEHGPLLDLRDIVSRAACYACRTQPRRYSNAASRPLSDADLMASTRRCRSIAVSNVGWCVSPSRIARAKRVYI
jgi:hypothetical protein